MSDTPSQNKMWKIAVDSVVPFDINSQGMEVANFSLAETVNRAGGNGIRGSRSRFGYRHAEVSKVSSGSIGGTPVAAEIDFFLPYILGGTTTGGVTTVADTVPEFVCLADKIQQRATYDGCRVGRATFSGSQGGEINWSLDIEAETETLSGTAFPSAITFPTTRQLVFGALVLTIEGSARQFAQFSLTIDNHLKTDRFNNNLTRGEIPAMDFSAELQVSFPYTSDNYALQSSAVAGAAGSLAMTDGSSTWTWAFANCKVRRQGAVMSGADETELPLTVDIYATNSAREIVVTKS